VAITSVKILPLWFTRTALPVLPTIPGHHWIIFTWGITLTAGMVLATDMTTGSPMESGLVTHRGITPTVTMANIRHGLPQLITTLIIQSGDLITVTVRVMMVVATKTEGIVVYLPHRRDIPVIGIWRSEVVSQQKSVRVAWNRSSQFRQAPLV